MLRVSATACSSRSRIASNPSAARIRSGAARRGLSRPLSRAWRTTPHAWSMSWSSSPVRAIQSSMSSSLHPRPSAVAMSVSSAPMRSSIASTWWAAARSRSGGHTIRLTSRPTRDADAGVEQPRDQQVAVVAVAGGEDDERRGGRRRRLGAEPAHRAGEQAHEDHDAERERVEPEDAPGGGGDQDADHARAHLLDAAPQRPVHGRVHGQQRRPGGEERLLDVEHLGGEDPRDDGRQDGLQQLRDVRPGDRIAQPLGEGGEHGSRTPTRSARTLS